MANERDAKQSSAKPANADPDISTDLDVRPEDVDKVKGGRARMSSDPCEGGEIAKRP